MTEPVRPVRVRSIRWEAEDIFSFVLAAPDNMPLAPFTPGAHVDVQLPNGLMRSYSLSGCEPDGAYRITVARDAASTGGSLFMADQLRSGHLIEIGEPRNNFPLDESAATSVFIAGGIGITPFLPMMRRLNDIAKPWRLHYCVRTRDRAALLGEIEALARQGAGEVVMNFDHEPGGHPLDLTETVTSLEPRDHVYCCGPIGMLDAFRAACDAAALPTERVHFEYFKSNVVLAAEGGFTLILAKSGKTLTVPAGQTILEAVMAQGIEAPFSCEEGVCGACETRVLAGEPDHRDLILSEQERAAGRTMMICCSGSKSPTLTLDI